jgi:hypothetical protein
MRFLPNLLGESGDVMRQVFKDAAQQEQFERDGYLTFDLLGPEEVEELKGLYAALGEKEVPSYGFHVSLDHSNRGGVSELTQRLYALLEPKVEQIFFDHQVFTASFVAKEPNPKGVVPPHQDWTFVDESEYWSATLWTPLVDVDMDNGALGVIKGSHKFFDWPRCSPSPQFKTPLGPHMFSIFPYLEIVPLKAGQSIMFDNRTLHASPPNTTEETRLAVGIGITHKDAQLCHHYLLPGTPEPQVESYRIEREFFLQYNNGILSQLHEEGTKPESWPVLSSYPLSLPSFSAEEMQVMIKSHPGNVINGPLIEKMARLFGYNLDGSKQEEAKTEPKPEPQPAMQSAASATPTKRGFFSRLFGKG